MEETKRRKVISYIIVFLIPVIVMLIAAIVVGIYPFGGKSAVVSDGNAQISYFMEYFFQEISKGNFPLFTYNGFGMDFLEIIAYYISSPLTIITYVIYRIGNIYSAISIMYLLRAGLAAVSMFWFLRKSFCHSVSGGRFSYNQQIWLASAFACLYALSAFSAVYFHMFIWSDTLIMLPICCYLLERGLKTEKWVGYAVSIGVLILCNFYMAYMVCLFLIPYTIYLIRTKVETKRFFKKFLRFALWSVVGIILAGMILIPAMYLVKLHGSPTLEPFDFSWFIYGAITVPEGLFNFLWENVPSFVLGSSSIEKNSFPVFTTILFFPFLFTVIFKNSKNLSAIEKRRRRWFIGFFIFMILSVYSAGIIYIVHGFAFPHGFPNRECFLYVFFFLSFAFEQLCIMNKPLKCEIITLFTISAGFLIYIYVVNFKKYEGSLPLASPLILFGYFFIVWELFGYKIFKKKKPANDNKMAKTRVVIALALCLTLEASLHFILISQSAFFNDTGGVMYQDALNNKLLQKNLLFNTNVLAGEKENGEINPFTGVELARIHCEAANVGFIAGNSPFVFSSTTRNKTSNGVMVFSGVYAKNFLGSNVYRCYAPNIPLSLALGQKYYLVEKPLEQDMESANDTFEYMAQADNYYLYQSKISSDFGYFVNNANVLKNIQTPGGDGVKRINQYFKGVIGKELYAKQKILKESSGQHNAYSRNYIIDIPAGENGVVSFLYSKGRTNASTLNAQLFLINGKAVNFDEMKIGASYLDFGIATTNRTFVITVPDRVRSLTYYSASKAKVEAFADHLSSQGAEDFQSSNRSFTATVTNKATTDKLYMLPVGYDAGWTCVVNGEQTPIKEINGFCGFMLPPGENHIEMTFWPQGLTAGMITTLAGIFFILTFALVKNRKHKKNTVSRN